MSKEKNGPAHVHVHVHVYIKSTYDIGIYTYMYIIHVYYVHSKVEHVQILCNVYICLGTFNYPQIHNCN